MSKCPSCKNGKLYERKKEKFTVKICYVCGYYEDNSPAYNSSPELLKSLFVEYFASDEGWEASPAVGQPFTSPVHWTEPFFC